MKWIAAKAAPTGHSFKPTAPTAVALVIIATYTYGRSARTPLSSGLSHRSRGGGTGRRAGFKIRFLKGSASSILAPGTTNNNGSSPFSVFWTLRNTARFSSAHRFRQREHKFQAVIASGAVAPSEVLEQAT